VAVLNSGMGAASALQFAAQFGMPKSLGSRDVVRSGPLLSLQTTVGGGSLINRTPEPAPPPPPPPPPPRPMYAMTQAQADAAASPPWSLIAAGVGALAIVGLVVAKKLKR
jgi:hypothetical protein